MCKTGRPAVDTLNIGDVSNEAGHNLIGWSNAWVKPGWGGTYGGGSSDESFRLLMGKGDGCDAGDVNATFEMNAGTKYATQLIIEHLDGSQTDSFDVYVNNVKIGSYVHIDAGGENWITSQFSFPPTTGVITVKLTATEGVPSWCADWGLVGISNALIK